MREKTVKKSQNKKTYKRGRGGQHFDRGHIYQPILPLENVNTIYHTEFHQIPSINVACVKKKQRVHKSKG